MSLVKVTAIRHVMVSLSRESHPPTIGGAVVFSFFPSVSRRHYFRHRERAWPVTEPASPSILGSSSPESAHRFSIDGGVAAQGPCSSPYATIWLVQLRSRAGAIGMFPCLRLRDSGRQSGCLPSSGTCGPVLFPAPLLMGRAHRAWEHDGSSTIRRSWPQLW